MGTTRCGWHKGAEDKGQIKTTCRLSGTSCSCVGVSLRQLVTGRGSSSTCSVPEASCSWPLPSSSSAEIVEPTATEARFGGFVFCCLGVLFVCGVGNRI